jgi:hypothetical protein
VSVSVALVVVMILVVPVTIVAATVTAVARVQIFHMLHMMFVRRLLIKHCSLCNERKQLHLPYLSNNLTT